MLIEDGLSGNKAGVNKANRLTVHAVAEQEDLHAVELGEAFNVNTGLMTVTGDATLIYLKNNEDEDLFIDAIALGSFEGVTHTDDPYVTIVRNPTGGDLISDATAVSMNQNRNFGSSEALTVDAYKGKVSGTLTGGNDLGILQATPGGRSFYAINLLLQKGSSIGIKLTLNGSGSASWYAAFIIHLKNAKIAG